MRCILLFVVAVFTLNGCAANHISGNNKEGFESKDSSKSWISSSDVIDKDFNKDGYNKDGYNKYGYDKDGFNMRGIHINTGTQFNESGYNVKGEKGFPLTFIKDSSYNVFSVVSIKIDGQPIALNQKTVVLNGPHLIEAQTTRDTNTTKPRNHSQIVNIQYDTTLRISDYGIYN